MNNDDYAAMVCDGGRLGPQGIALIVENAAGDRHQNQTCGVLCSQRTTRGALAPLHGQVAAALAHYVYGLGPMSVDADALNGAFRSLGLYWHVKEFGHC